MGILVTGGAGYIGSHTCIELLNQGYKVIVLDNLSNSSEEALKRVERITGAKVTFYKVDLLEIDSIEEIFKKEKIDVVIHFAGLKAVGESVVKPLKYYENNVNGTINLCKVMEKYNVKKIVFSSSATVYGNPKSVPIREEFPLSVTNPYGRTKLMLEEILGDLNIADSNWRVILLRYFNPIGAHKSGLIGENPKGIPNNLVPYITQVAVGKHPYVKVFGNEYATCDGTGVRDYIHVVDLAAGHVKAIESIEKGQGVDIYNLGTGTGYSVIQMIKAFEKACQKEIPYQIELPRAGDIGTCYADSSKAYDMLGWKAKYGLEEMCEDSWRWQATNPNGYEEL
jgi:UDP-glucose-4-epimerase